MTLGGFTENPSVLSSAQGSEVGQGEGEALLFSLYLESLVLVPPLGNKNLHNLHLITIHLTIFPEQLPGSGFNVSFQHCLWKQWGTHYLAFLPRWVEI